MSAGGAAGSRRERRQRSGAGVRRDQHGRRRSRTSRASAARSRSRSTCTRACDRRRRCRATARRPRPQAPASVPVASSSRPVSTSASANRSLAGGPICSRARPPPTLLESTPITYVVPACALSVTWLREAQPVADTLAVTRFATADTRAVDDEVREVVAPARVDRDGAGGRRGPAPPGGAAPAAEVDRLAVLRGGGLRQRAAGRVRAGEDGRVGDVVVRGRADGELHRTGRARRAVDRDPVVLAGLGSERQRRAARARTGATDGRGDLALLVVVDAEHGREAARARLQRHGAGRVGAVAVPDGRVGADAGTRRLAVLGGRERGRAA